MFRYELLGFVFKFEGEWRGGVWKKMKEQMEEIDDIERKMF